MQCSRTLSAAVAAVVSMPLLAQSAVITAGSPTTGLVPPTGPAGSVLFLDNASIGGGDTNNSITPLTTIRSLDLNGAAGAPGIGGTVSVTGFGFAVPGPGNPRSNNTAASMTFGFTYLGLDGVVGGGDDVVLGTTSAIVWAADLPAAGTHYVNFDAPLSAAIDGMNENFLITFTPTGGNFRFKTTTGTLMANAKFSVAGSFAPIPEPASVAAIAGGLTLVARRRRA